MQEVSRLSEFWVPGASSLEGAVREHRTLGFIMGVAMVRFCVESTLNLAYSQDQAMSLLHNILGKASTGDAEHPAASWRTASLLCSSVRR